MVNPLVSFPDSRFVLYFSLTFIFLIGTVGQVMQKTDQKTGRIVEGTKREADTRIWLAARHAAHFW